jgi:FkbM family methyltransferase
MFKAVTHPIRKFLNSLGYEVVKLQDSLTTIKVGNWLQKLNIETILDIGSNEGQFIDTISKTLPDAQFYAFEPISVCYNQLLQNTKHLRVKPFNCGLSDINGTTEINVSTNLVSSSILGMKDLHKNLYPESTYMKKEVITLKRLDDVLENEQLDRNILIKIDVQGYEQKVLSGAIKSVKTAAVVIIETSFEPLYNGQWLFDNVYTYFTNAQFRFMGFADQSLSKKSGIPLYADAIFVRQDLVADVFVE